MALGDGDLNVGVHLKADTNLAAESKKAAAALRMLANEGRKSGEQTKRAVDGADASLRKLGDDGQRAGEQLRRIGAQTEALAGGYRRLGRAAAGYLTVRTALQALRTADDYLQLQGQIDRVTASQAESNRVWEQLYSIAQRNGSALSATVSLFRSLSRSAQELGANTDQILTVTNAIQQLAELDKVSGAQLSGALLQLGQLFSGPIVQAQELNSLIDAMPGMLQKVAAAMGMTTGAFINAAKEGKILVRDFFDALLAKAPEINQEMVSVQNNLGRADQQFITSITRLLGELDKATGATQWISDFITGAAEKLNDMSNWLSGQNVEIRSAVELEKERAEVLGKIYKLSLEIDNLYGIPAAAAKMNLSSEQAKLEELNRKIAEAQARAAVAAPTSASVAPSIAAPAGPSESERHIQSMIAALKEQAATFGLDSEQIALYKLSLEHATPAQIALAQSLVATIESQRQAEEASKAAAEAAKAQAEAAKALNEQLDQQAEKWKDQVDPTREYAREIAQLDVLYDLGKLSADTYAQATIKVHDALIAAGQQANSTATDMDKFAVKAAKDIQTAFGDTLLDIAQGKFGQIEQLWINLLQKMVSEALAAQLGRYLFGSTFSTTGQLGGVVGAGINAIAGVFHEGGIVGQGGRSRIVDPALFIGAPRYHSGALVGNERPAILQTGEEVLSRSDPRNRANGGNSPLQLKIVNTIDPRLAADLMQSAPGTRAVLNVIQSNAGAVRHILQQS